MKLAIEKVIYGGQGLARIPASEGAQAGKRIFVPFTLPGEQVSVDLSEDARGYAVGHLRHIEAASPLRTQPVCPYFTHCGGCHLQHATYVGQLEIKRSVLCEALERAGVRSLPKISILHDEPLAYRNRMRLHVQTQPTFSIGYREHHARTLIPIAQCPIVSPLLERCLHALQAMGEAGCIRHDIEELDFFINHDASAILLSVFTARHEVSHAEFSANWEMFFSKVAALLPELTGAALFYRDRDCRPGLNFTTSAPSEPQILLRWKAQSFDYRVLERSYRVSIGAFFQGNYSLLPKFVALVTDGWRGRQAWDLYAGGGLF